MPIRDGRLRERSTETLVYVIAYPYILFFKFNGILEPDNGILEVEVNSRK